MKSDYIFLYHPLASMLKSISTLFDFIRRNSNLRIQFFDQGISGVTNYSLLIIALLLHDLRTIGILTLFQSIYAIFVGITRTSLGSISILNKSKYFGFIPIIMAIICGLIGGFTFWISIPESEPKSTLCIMLMVFPILQETFRFHLIGKSLYRLVLRADIFWLTTIVVILPITYALYSVNVSTLLFIWSLGALFSTFYLVCNSYSDILRKATFQHKYFFRKFFTYVLTSIIAEINTFLVNLIIISNSSTTLLGEVRAIQLCFLPFAFLINSNKIILLQFFVENNKEKIDNILNAEKMARILFLSLGVVVAIITVDKRLVSIVLFIIVGISAELAFRRNMIFIELTARGNNRVIILNLTFYLIISLIFFLISSQFLNLFFLVSTLIITELVTFFVSSNTKNRRIVF